MKKDKTEESFMIDELSYFNLDYSVTTWGEFKEINLTPSNINKIWKKQCEIIEVINKILDAKILIK